MKHLFASALLLSAICSHAQTISIDLSNSQEGRYTPRFSVQAANGDRSVDTPEKIFAVNKALAKAGNVQAAWQLGLSYLQGYGVQQNLVQAERWFKEGAVDPDQKALVAEMHKNGEYFPKDLGAAALWFTAAGRPGDLFELAQAYRLASPPQTAKAIAIYVDLLKQSGAPEVRRVQMELGNFVLDGKYSAGDTPAGQAQNLEWARTITQELLGQEEYKIAVDYDVSRPGLPADKAMWLRFCKRAAAYNIDLAQNFYAQAIAQGEAPNHTGYDEIAWLKLASGKQTGLRSDLRVLESGLTAAQHKDADEAYDALVQTRSYDGAYYTFDDPLRTLKPSAIEAMPQDDPDVQLRRAFSLELAAKTNARAYREAMDLYRTVRDRREIDIRFVLGRNALNGTGGIPKNPSDARFWLQMAADRGSQPAKKLLNTLASQSPTASQ